MSKQVLRDLLLRDSCSYKRRLCERHTYHMTSQSAVRGAFMKRAVLIDHDSISLFISVRLAAGYCHDVQRDKYY